MGMSKPPNVASRAAGGLGRCEPPPAGYGAEPRSKKMCEKNEEKICYRQLITRWRVPRTFLYKLLTDDFLMVQVF